MTLIKKRVLFLTASILLFIFFPAFSGDNVLQAEHAANHHAEKDYLNSSPQSISPCYEKPNQFYGKVERVIDGDTLRVRTDSDKEVTIRLANIDAPEKNQPFGLKARRVLLNLAFNKLVVIQAQAVDRYGRTVAIVCVNGINISGFMVSNGLAWVYTRYSRDSSLPGKEKMARDKKQGLWSLLDPVPPWEWRKIK